MAAYCEGKTFTICDSDWCVCKPPSTARQQQSLPVISTTSVRRREVRDTLTGWCCVSNVLGWKTQELLMTSGNTGIYSFTIVVHLGPKASYCQLKKKNWRLGTMGCFTSVVKVPSLRNVFFFKKKITLIVITLYCTYHKYLKDSHGLSEIQSSLFQLPVAHRNKVVFF